jgi:hypothetical protein
MRLTRSACWLVLAVGALFCCGLNAADAQSAAPAVDVRQACTPDAFRLCNEFIPDEGKVKACMLAKHAQLSVECRSAMAASNREARHAGRAHCGRHSKHCG